jgi:hypothetical protein
MIRWSQDSFSELWAEILNAEHCVEAIEKTLFGAEISRLYYLKGKYL